MACNNSRWKVANQSKDWRIRRRWRRRKEEEEEEDDDDDDDDDDDENLVNSVQCNMEHLKKRVGGCGLD